MLISANPVLHARTRHIELDMFFVHEKVQRKELAVRHIRSSLQVADGFTKPMSGLKFKDFHDKLKVVNPDYLR